MAFLYVCCHIYIYNGSYCCFNFFVAQYFSSIPTQQTAKGSYEMGYKNPILQMNDCRFQTFKLMQGEIKVYAQGHVAREQLGQDLNLGRLTADKIIHYT